MKTCRKTRVKLLYHVKACFKVDIIAVYLLTERTIDGDLGNVAWLILFLVGIQQEDSAS